MEKSDIRVVDGEICASSAVICEIFGVSRETVSKWVREKGAPRRGTARGAGAYPLAAFVRWYIDNKTAGACGSGGDNPEKLTLAQQKTYYETRLKAEQAENAEMKNAIQKGEYIPKDDVVKELQRFFISVKRSMEGYSRKVAMEVSPYVEPEIARTVEQNIAESTRDALNQLAVRGVYSAKKQ